MGQRARIKDVVAGKTLYKVYGLGDGSFIDKIVVKNIPKRVTKKI